MKSEVFKNEKIEMLNRFVQNTDVHIFLTGKAGTGKTTFLRNLAANTYKRMVIVAPTGVAAINAGGSGHSLKWCAEHGAKELFGLDISEEQLKTAKKLLDENGYSCTLYHQPMEENTNIPKNYFDVVYSIYAIGWTTDLEKTIKNAASYLKQGGTYIFSWDHPLLHCVDLESVAISGGNRTVATEERIIFSGNYLEEDYYTFEKYGNPLTLQNRKLSTYINTLADAGFAVEKVIEETSETVLEKSADFSSGYYADFKAKHFPLSIVIKARKL